MQFFYIENYSLSNIKLPAALIMKTFAFYAIAALLSITLLQACGSDDITEQQDQQAIEDSLAQADQAAEREQMRRESLEQARADSIAAEEERRRVDFSDAGEYVVQVEAWRSQEKAEQQAEEWKQKGYDRATVIMFGSEGTGDVWYRVRLGEFDSREMAERLRGNLTEDYEAQAWVSRKDATVAPEPLHGD